MIAMVFTPLFSMYLAIAGPLQRIGGDHTVGADRAFRVFIWISRCRSGRWMEGDTCTKPAALYTAFAGMLTPEVA